MGAHMKNEPIFHERCIQVQDGMILLRMDMPDQLRKWGPWVGENIAQRHSAGFRKSRFPFGENSILEKNGVCPSGGGYRPGWA
jgi:hypothetical protein